MMSMSELLIINKPRPRWQRDLIEDKGYSVAKRAEMYLELDETERKNNMDNRLRKQYMCSHNYVCIYRHPKSDLRCTKCDKIITYDEHINQTTLTNGDQQFMITASQARSQIENQEKEDNSKQYKEICERIITAINMGRYEVYYTDSAISDFNKTQLKKLGYEVSSDGRDGHHSYNISWA